MAQDALFLLSRRRRPIFARLFSLAALAAVVLLSAAGPVRAGGQAWPYTDAPWLVYSELQDGETTFWMSAARNLSLARPIANLRHAEGYAPRASVSPDGGAVAALAAPHGAVDPPAHADLWLIDIPSGQARKLAAGLDLAAIPVWSPDSRALALRRSLPEDERLRYQLLLLSLADGSVRTVADMAADWVGALGWSPDGGTLRWASFSAGEGTWLRSVAPATGDAWRPVRISGGLARDLQLSPDGTQLLGNELLSSATPPYRTTLIDVAVGAATVLAASQEPPPPPRWRVSGQMTLAGLSGLAPGSLALADIGGTPPQAVLPAPAGGSLLPLDWSPDGQLLAARSLAAGSDQLGLIDIAGGFTPVSGSCYLEFVGWLP